MNKQEPNWAGLGKECHIVEGQQLEGKPKITNDTMILETDAATVTVRVTDKPTNPERNKDYIRCCHDILGPVKDQVGDRQSPLADRITTLVTVFRTLQEKVNQHLDRVIPIHFRSEHTAEKTEIVVERLIAVQGELEIIQRLHSKQTGWLQQIQVALASVFQTSGSQTIADNVWELVKRFKAREEENAFLRTANDNQFKQLDSIGEAINKVESDVTLEFGISNSLGKTVAEKIQRLGELLLQAVRANREIAAGHSLIPADERAQLMGQIEILKQENCRIHSQSEYTKMADELKVAKQRISELEASAVSDPIYAHSVRESHNLLDSFSVPKCGDVPSRITRLSDDIFFAAKSVQDERISRKLLGVRDPVEIVRVLVSDLNRRIR